MPTRTAHTTWTGGLQDGTGTVTLVSSGLGSYEISFPKRAADDADGTTSPEELIAAAHASCFSGFPAPRRTVRLNRYICASLALQRARTSPSRSSANS